jgi:hypothetical protein
MSSKSSSLTNSTGAMTFYFIFTSIYYMLNYYLVNKDKFKSHSDSSAISAKSYRNTMLFGVYVLIVIIGQFFINLNLTTQMCHKAQGSQTLMITIIPWMVIFGVFNLLLSFFPGWLKPFSNTFGYFVASWFDLKDAFMDTLIKKTDKFAKIYDDPQLMINELPSNLEEFINVINELQIFQKDNDKLNNLYNYILIKHFVSEYVWYMLIGLLITTMSYNYVINLTCSESVQSMKERHDKYISNENKKKKLETKSSITPSQQTEYRVLG